MELYGSVEAYYYDYYSTGVPGDLNFYVEEAVKAGSPVLELGCGTGRITLPVAQAGVDITGLDLSPAMLAVARKKCAALPPEVQARVTLVHGDMRAFSLDQRFSLIFIPYRAFMHLMNVADQKRALACIREHLAPDGRLVFNIFDPRLDIIAAHATPLGRALKFVQEFIHPESGRRVTVWDTRQYDQATQLLEQYFIFEELDDSDHVVDKSYALLTLRYSFRFEMQNLLELCGYHIEALYGAFDRQPYHYGGEQIWVARRS